MSTYEIIDVIFTSMTFVIALITLLIVIVRLTNKK